MNTVGHWRWERLLLVIVLALGVLAMHATPAVAAAAQPVASGTPMPGTAAAGSAHAMSGAGQPIGDQARAGEPGGGEQGGHGSNPATHHVLSVCLAILGTLVLLATAVAAFIAVARRSRRTTARAVPAAIPVAARPPPTHAVRLAELCVLRN